MPRTKKDSTITDKLTLATTAKTSDAKDPDNSKASTIKNSKTSTKQANTATPITDTTTKTTAKPVAKIVSKTAETKAYPAVEVKEPEPKPVTITRIQLSQEVAKAVGRMMEITNRDAEAIVAEILSSMTDALKNGDEIEIRGFGSLRLRTRNPRRGRNPKTGESVDVPSKTTTYFKMGADLKMFLKQS